MLDSARAAAGTKGVSLAVIVPEQGLFTGVSGISSPGVPVAMVMRFAIASCTKLFISTALTKLQEQGVLSLEDHLYQWLPVFPNVDSTATIRQLLSHQTGIFDYVNDTTALLALMLADTSHFWTPQEILAYVGPPHFAPGHGYDYSNTNYLLAGMIIEAATGETWVEKLHDLIFDPLAMDSTFVGAFEPRNGLVAAEWISNSYIVTNTPMTGEFSMVNAAGSILSTPQEMAGWYNALFNGVVVSGPSLQQLSDFDPTSFYGLGLEEYTYKNHVGYGHGGSMLGYRSKIWYDVQTKSVMCLLQNDGMTAISDKFNPLLDVLYDEFPKKQNDAGISTILSPWEFQCGESVSPSVMLTNFGSDSLTSANILFRIDGGEPAVYYWSGLLSPGDTMQVDLPQINAEEGSHQFTCFTNLPNGAQEGYTFNDTVKSTFISVSLSSGIVSLSESFDDQFFPPAGWVLNSSSIFQWGHTPLAHFSGTGSAVRSNYMDNHTGASYNIDLPVIHISAGSHRVLDFKYAYAPYSSSYCDSLQVLISNDCGSSWQTLFNKGCMALQTAPPTIYAFYPQSNDDWKQESFSLEAYAGDALIRFRSVCGYGNNLYLDDVNISFPAGAVENNSVGKLAVYPNPAFGKITILASGEGRLFILNASGRLILQMEITGPATTFDISALSGGVYIAKVVGEYGVQVGKFIKQ